MRTIPVTEMDCPGSMLDSLSDDLDRINKIPGANAQIWRRHIVGHGPRFALVRDVADDDLKAERDEWGLCFWPSIDVPEYMDRGWMVIV